MKRLTLSLICILAFIGIGLIASLAMADDDDHRGNATVSFGQWDPNDPDLLPEQVPLDRLIGNPGMGRGNNHELIPNKVTIKAGGAVNFIIAGLHNLQVYDDGTQPGDISRDSPLGGLAGGIIDDDNNRIYRGLNPNTVLPTGNRDRVEVVRFSKPGTYLVICGVRDHFVNDGMFGFVKVKKGDD